MADFPFLDLKRVYAAHKDAYESAALKCLEGGWYVLGEEVKKFEAGFASHHQAAGRCGCCQWYRCFSPRAQSRRTSAR